MLRVPSEGVISMGRGLQGRRLQLFGRWGRSVLIVSWLERYRWSPEALGSTLPVSCPLFFTLPLVISVLFRTQRPETGSQLGDAGDGVDFPDVALVLRTGVGRPVQNRYRRQVNFVKHWDWKESRWLEGRREYFVFETQTRDDSSHYRDVRGSPDNTSGTPRPCHPSSLHYRPGSSESHDCQLSERMLGSP